MKILVDSEKRTVDNEVIFRLYFYDTVSGATFQYDSKVLIEHGVPKLDDEIVVEKPVIIIPNINTPLEEAQDEI